MPLRLRVTSDNAALPGGQKVREFRATGGSIGRAPDNDWILPDENRYVSSRHALIDFQGGAYYLVDTSRNGVFVNDADTPVGRGHPQRLFHGDHIRIGDYDVVVELSEDASTVPDDGMRDSIVRAQLVPEAESVELQLVEEEKLLQDANLKRHLTPATALVQRSRGGAQPDARPSTVAAAMARPQAQAPRPRPVAVPKATAAPDPDSTHDEYALAQLLEAAGLDRASVAGATQAEVMQVTGRLMRVLVAGLMDLLRDRAVVKEGFRIPQTVIEKTQNNPLKFSPGVDEALRFLLNDRGQDHYLSSEDAVKAGFRDLRQHEQALVKSIGRAARDFAERFDPVELRQRFDKGLKRNGILSGSNKLKYWDLYEETYISVTQGEVDSAPELFKEDFSRAYLEELESSRLSRRR